MSEVYKARNDAENRSEWWNKAEVWEAEFIKRFGKELGVMINPFKEINKTAPDLICQDSVFGDLKFQSAPFFKAKDLYGVDVQYSWSLNEVDIIDYAYKHYDKFKIYVWSSWKKDMEYKGIKVKAMSAVFETDIQKLRRLIATSPPLHEYIKRKYGKDNAKSSYVLDLSDEEYFRRVI